MNKQNKTKKKEERQKKKKKKSYETWSELTKSIFY